MLPFKSRRDFAEFCLATTPSFWAHISVFGRPVTCHSIIEGYVWWEEYRLLQGWQSRLVFMHDIGCKSGDSSTWLVEPKLFATSTDCQGSHDVLAVKVSSFSSEASFSRSDNLVDQEWSSLAADSISACMCTLSWQCPSENINTACTASPARVWAVTAAGSEITKYLLFDAMEWFCLRAIAQKIWVKLEHSLGYVPYSEPFKSRHQDYP